MLSTSGTPLTAFGAPVAAVGDKSDAAAALNVWHAASAGTTQPIATPRLNGLLGGLGLNTIIPPMLPASGQQLPLMDPDQGLISAAMAMGSSTAWTLFLVWSRPNWRQSSNAASTLLSVGGTPILAGDNNGGGGRLVLFPGSPTDRSDLDTHAPPHPRGDPAQHARHRRRCVARCNPGRHRRPQSHGSRAQRAAAVPPQRRRRGRCGVLVP